MTATVRTLVSLAALASATAALGAVPTYARDGAKATVVRVVEKEMSISASPTTIPPGKIVLHVRNAGAVQHELVLLRGDAMPSVSSFKADESRRISELAELPPGGKGELTVTLSPGTYLLICNLAGHYQLGMHARLRVGS